MEETDTTSVQETLREVLAGRPLAPTEAQALLACDAEDLPLLLEAAARLRDRGKGRTVTYSPKVFIPLTQLCRDRCAYCTFRREPQNQAGNYLTPDEVLAIAEAGEKARCAEALFVLGERPEQRYPAALDELKRLGFRTTIDYLCAMCELVLKRTKLLPHSNAGTLTPPEMLKLREVNGSLGMMLETVSARLMQAGEAHEHAPSKHPALRLKSLQTAGQLQTAFTTGLLIGIGETAQERVESLFVLRSLQQEFGHIQEVILQNFKPKPGTPMAGAHERSALEMLKIVAVARLVLGSQMNIQIPPNLNDGICSLYLHAGINDWGGLSSVTEDFVNPEAPWPSIEKLRTLTEAEGFELRARLPLYPEYVLQKPEFVSSGLHGRIRALVDTDGLIPEASGPC